MENLSTIQKRNNLNTVCVDPVAGPGGGHHKYAIFRAGSNPNTREMPLLEVQFQNGPRHGENSIDGVLDADLLEIVRYRLKTFQKSEYATSENACALTHIEEALMWMNKRAEDRAERNVLGTMNK